MSTKLPPGTANDMLQQRRTRSSDTERALDRAAEHGEQVDGEEPETAKDRIKRAAERNDRRNKDNG